MNIRRPVVATLAALGVAAGIALSGSAAIAGPTTQPGCTFNAANGTTTCVTTKVDTNTQTVIGGGAHPFTAGSPASALCAAVVPGSTAYGQDEDIDTEPAVVQVVTSTTTTTVYQGAYNGRGQKVLSSTPTRATTYGVVAGVIDCDAPDGSGLASYPVAGNPAGSV